jgi:hypothetical protein
MGQAHSWNGETNFICDRETSCKIPIRKTEDMVALHSDVS